MDKFDKAIEFLQEKQRSLKCAHMMKSMDGEATEKDIDEYREEFALYRLALTALKQQQEREHGCKYCTKGKDIQIKFDGEEAGRAWMHNCSDGYGLFLEGEVITYIDVKYCPMCGTDLRKAVAE